MRVRVEGLSESPQYNGQLGTIECELEVGRLRVVLDQDGKVFSLKRENLVEVQPGQEGRVESNGACQHEEKERASRVFWGRLSTVAAGAFAVAAVVAAAVAGGANQSSDNDGRTNDNDRRNGEFLRVYHLMDGNSHPQFKLVRNRIAHGGSAATSEELDRIRRWVA